MTVFFREKAKRWDVWTQIDMIAASLTSLPQEIFLPLFSCLVLLELSSVCGTVAGALILQGHSLFVMLTLSMPLCVLECPAPPGSIVA